MIQTIQARLYQGYNVFTNTPQLGLPSLSYIDIPLEVEYGPALKDHKICFKKGGIDYCYSLKSIGIDAELEELIITFRLTTTDAEGETIHLDVVRTLKELENNGFAYYDPTKTGLNTFQEFEASKSSIGTNGVALLSYGEFMGRRALNGLIHAVGFWLQFPFHAETGEFQQPLVLGYTITSPTVVDEVVNNDGTITINVIQSSVPVLFTIDGTWSTNNVFTGLPSGNYTIYAMQQNREKVVFVINVTV